MIPILRPKGDIKEPSNHRFCLSVSSLLSHLFCLTCKKSWRTLYLCDKLSRYLPKHSILFNDLYATYALHVDRATARRTACLNYSHLDAFKSKVDRRFIDASPTSFHSTETIITSKSIDINERFKQPANGRGSEPCIRTAGGWGGADDRPPPPPENSKTKKDSDKR